MTAAKKSSGKRSAGLLLYRKRGDAVEVFLVHPGGPFWTRKDDGAWSIPKGEFAADESGKQEDPLAAAKREFREETGFTVNGEFRELTPVRQAGGKMVYAWAVEARFATSPIRRNSSSADSEPSAVNGSARPANSKPSPIDDSAFSARANSCADGDSAFVEDSESSAVNGSIFSADIDPAKIRSNTFSMEWPPRSGQIREFPEVDRAAWFDLPTARRKILKSQLPLLDQVE